LKKIYIEVGAYSLHRTRDFLNEHKGEEWMVFLFEPNPLILPFIKEEIKKSEFKNIVLYEVAAGSTNGTRKFYLGRRGASQVAATLFEGKGYIDKNKFEEVQCIDFNQWFLDNVDKGAEIHMSMDIEGGEYEVLPAMIKSGAINYISSMDVEFHCRKFKGKNREIFNPIHKELMEFFKNCKLKNVVLNGRL